MNPVAPRRATKRFQNISCNMRTIALKRWDGRVLYIDGEWLESKWRMAGILIPVASPPFSIIFSNPLLRCPMYQQHFLTSTVFQIVEIPSTNCCLVVGFTALCMNCFISCQRFSIGFASGDSGGYTTSLCQHGRKIVYQCGNNA